MRVAALDECMFLSDKSVIHQTQRLGNQSGRLIRFCPILKTYWCGLGDGTETAHEKRTHILTNTAQTADMVARFCAYPDIYQVGTAPQRPSALI
jgi:hypothetical protein